MRGVLVEVPEQMLAERRRLGLDGRDEMWDGVVHLLPPASERHQQGGLCSDVLGVHLRHSRRRAPPELGRRLRHTVTESR